MRKRGSEMGRTELRLSGSGGQGLILAGIILGEAASIHDNKQAVQSQSYGPEARGGASRSEVIISTERIEYPKVREADVLLCLSQESYARYAKTLKEDGVLLYDTFHVKDTDHVKARAFGIAFTELAHEKAGRKIMANVVALGAIAAVTGVVTLDALKAAVLSRVPKGTDGINLKALEAGFEAGQSAIR